MTRTLRYRDREYSLTDVKDAIPLTKLTNPDLAMLHNLVGSDLNPKTDPVSKFSDKETGVRRTWKMLETYNAVSNKSPAKKAEPAKVVIKERKKRIQRFVFPLGDELRSVRTGTNRAILIDLLTKGATFEECMAATWGKNEDMTPEIQHKTTYEGIRLLHYYVGYGMKHDLETGIIQLVKTKK